MPIWTKSAWYAHCWIFGLFQFGKPTTGLGSLVWPGPLLNWLNVVHARVIIPRAAPRFSSLIGYSDDVVKRHYVEFGLFGVANDSGYVFYHNLDSVLLLFVFIRLDQKYYLYFYLNCWHNCFYKVLACSLPSGDLLLQTEYKGTIVWILHNTISF